MIFMIKSLKIHGLFGTFDYDIKLPEQGNYLILTGPNGYGKTTILTVIENLATGNLLELYSVPFESMHVEYDSFNLDIISMTVRTAAETEDTESTRRESLRFIISNDAEPLNLILDEQRISEARRYCSWNRQLSLFDDFDYEDEKRHKKEKLSLEKSKILLEYIAKDQEQERFLIYVNSELNPHRFIPAQRLYSRNSNDELENSIEIVSDKFRSFLRQSYFAFLQNSQKHDSQFIDMLLTGNNNISQKEYDTAVRVLKEQVVIAMRYDLSAPVKLPEYNEDKSVILNYFLKDTFDKYSTLKKPLRDLTLFNKLLEDKKLVNKDIEYSREYGIRFVSRNDHKEISLNSLSSGEKNEILMLHDFIFNLEDGSLLMIDEPEISLHVAWQREFMKDIVQIATQKGLRVIIATHSPQIIGSKWSECYDLFYAVHE